MPNSLRQWSRQRVGGEDSNTKMRPGKWRRDRAELTRLILALQERDSGSNRVLECR